MDSFNQRLRTVTYGKLRWMSWAACATVGLGRRAQAMTLERAEVPTTRLSQQKMSSCIIIRRGTS